VARNFDGSDDVLTVSAGGLSGLDGGAITIAFILKFNDTTNGSIVYAKTSGSALVFQINADGGTWYYETTDSFRSMGTASTSDNWHLFGVTKANGNTTPRSHKYVYDTNTFSHADAASAFNDSSAAVGASGAMQFGRYGSANEYANMELAICGIWDRVLTDAEFENLPFSLAHWYASAPVGLWVFDQSATSQTVIDHTGGGANQSAITGTAVSTVSVPVFGYGDVAQSLSSSAAAGGASVDADGSLAVTATETGTAAVDRAASGNLAVTATETGTASVDRAATGDEAITATATGTAAVDRAADGALAVTATATGTANVDPAIAGNEAITATLAGQAAVDRAADGALAVTATAAGTAAVDRAATGTLAVTATITGDAEIVGRVDVDGTRAVTATITGTAAVDRAASGSLAVTAGLAGTAALALDASGALVVTATLTGLSDEAEGSGSPIGSTAAGGRLASSTSPGYLTSTTPGGRL
jgi:hypothetical protein